MKRSDPTEPRKSLERELLAKTSHRPWPPPSTPWDLVMGWRHVLLLHWPVRADDVRPFIPQGLELEIFEGSAWLSIVAVSMRDVRLRYMPQFAACSFPEISVRTYVWTPGRSGVWFLSVDAANRAVVRAARLYYGLPYYRARIRVKAEAEAVCYTSNRRDKSGRDANFDGRYEADGPVYRSAPETLDRWLTDRYCVYAVERSGRAAYSEIHHAPWPLQRARGELRANSLIKALGIVLPEQPPVAHFARELHVIAWRMAPIEEIAGG